jgi:hypothetical protein
MRFMSDSAVASDDNDLDNEMKVVRISLFF